MTNNNSYTYMTLNTLTDANLLKVTSPKDGKKRLALTFKAKTDAGTVVSFTEYAMAEPANELQALAKQSMLNRYPYIMAGRAITAKTTGGVQAVVKDNTKYNNVTGWIQSMGNKGLDMAKAEQRKVNLENSIK